MTELDYLRSIDSTLSDIASMVYEYFEEIYYPLINSMADWLPRLGTIGIIIIGLIVLWNCMRY